MESDYYKTVIKNYREKEDLTQEALSEKLGCDQTYISQLERGKRAPSVDFFISFSNVFGYIIISREFLKQTPLFHSGPFYSLLLYL